MFNWKWETGRQHQSENRHKIYRKLKLWSSSFLGFGSDCYIIKYSPYYSLRSHIDPVKTGYRHFRLNITLKGNGKFHCDKVIINIFNKIILFRPDLHAHYMHNSRRTRIVLSFGFLLRETREKRRAKPCAQKNVT